MRTTVTLDPDTLALIKAYIREKGVSFKDAVNHGIRLGLGGRSKGRRPFRQKTYNMGEPAISLRKALQFAGQLEDEEIVRDLTIRK